MLTGDLATGIRGASHMGTFRQEALAAHIHEANYRLTYISRQLSVPEALLRELLIDGVAP